jgi:hypothetical protein
MRKPRPTDSFEFKQFMDKCVFHLAEAIEKVRTIKTLSKKADIASRVESVEASIRWVATKLAEDGIHAKEDLNKIAPD